MYLETYQTTIMKLLAVFIFAYERSLMNIWKGSKYGSAALFLIFLHFLCLDTWMNIQTFCFSSESVQLLCSRDAYQRYFKIFHWFSNHLLHIDHGNIKFSYIYTIEMQKSSLWKTTRWNAKLIYYINKNNNKNNIKNQDRITRAFEKFPLSETILCIK